ncbi:Patellin-3 [Nymphaea thermarum]|nr:Patellin-3 [Nymphaea thermarum]
MTDDTQASAPEATQVVEATVKETTPVKAEEKAAPAEETKPMAEVIPPSASFKEESNVVHELEDPHKKALDELKQLVEQALRNNEFADSPPSPPSAQPAAPQTAETAAAEVVVVEEKLVVKVAEVAAVEQDTKAVGEVPPPAEPSTALEVVEEVTVKVVEEVTPPPPSQTAGEAPAAEDSGVKTVEVVQETARAEAPAPLQEEVTIWGIPLLGDERSDTLLLKFLRARDFKVKETLDMIKKTVRWRKDYKVEELFLGEEDLGDKGFEKIVFMHGTDRQGHPVCYNVFGAFQDKELFKKTSGTERDLFLRWRIQFLEKGVRQLDFRPRSTSTVIQVTDLKGSPGLLNRELQLTMKALSVMLDNYPELVAKQVVINVPWWYLAYTKMLNTFFTPRTRSKFVYATPSRSTEALFRYIAPEHIPIQYGGLSKEDDTELSTADAASESIVKPSSHAVVEFIVSEACTLVWELRVLGWDVSYGSEFVPDAEDSYTIIVEKTRKVAATDEPIIRTSFKIGEPGKVVLRIENASSKKKKLLYRSKTKMTAV